MRFLIAVIDGATGTATGDEMAAIDAFNDGLRASGHWLFAGGLASPATAMVIDNRAGVGKVSAGPLHSLPEYMSGFWLIEAPDQATAQRLAAAGSLACNRKVELRRLHGG